MHTLAMAFYRFGEYTLAPKQFELRKGAEVVPLEPQVLLVLAMLVTHRDRLVLKEEILSEVWGDTFVAESTLSSRIMAARKAIGDSGSRQTWIKTVHGRGFRFVGEVAEADEPPQDSASAPLLLRSAESALRENRVQDAADLLNDAYLALQAAGFAPDAEYARWHRLQGQCLLLEQGWSSEAARTHYLESIRLAEGVGAVDVFRSSRYDLATMLEVRGDFDGSATLMSAAVADPQDAEADAEAHELLACSLFHQGQFMASADQAKRGLDALQGLPEQRLSSFYGEDAQVSCLHWLAICSWFLGREEEALRLSGRALRLSEKPGMIFCLAHSRQQATLLHQLRGDAAQCAHWAQALVSIGTRQKLDYRRAFGQILLGWAASRSKDAIAAPMQIQAAVQEIAALGAHMELPYFQALLADAHLMASDPRRACELLDRSISDALERPGFFYLSEMYRLRALAALQMADQKKRVHAWLMKAEEVALAQNATVLADKVRETSRRISDGTD
jgi:DNA-binding winged helix-turn-helix (wHTH) protein